MKNKIVLFFISFLFISCQQKIKPKDIAKINGYWEIEKVVFDQGEDKKYTVNKYTDYFEIDTKNTGIRKKVMVQLDGSLIEDETFEKIQINFKDDKVYINYSTPFSKWSEELVGISDEELVFKNAENIEYHYKRAETINSIKDGKEIK